MKPATQAKDRIKAKDLTPGSRWRVTLKTFGPAVLFSDYAILYQTDRPIWMEVTENGWCDFYAGRRRARAWHCNPDYAVAHFTLERIR